MAFKFPLATVLRVREIAEKREERLLQQIVQEIAEVQMAIILNEDETARVQNFRHAQINLSLKASNVRFLYEEQAELKQRHSDLGERLNKLEALKQAQATLYYNARCEREMLSDMRGAMEDVYETEVSKREQTVLDDNYIARRPRTNAKN